MFDRLNTSQELFAYRLGSALTMELILLEELEELEGYARLDQIKRALRAHREQTGEHAGNIERCFTALGADVAETPCPAAEAIGADGRATIRKAGRAFVDAAVLAAAMQSEHHEIAMYETLITHAQSHGDSEVVELLRQNLRQEESALQTARAALRAIASEGIAVGSS